MSIYGQFCPVALGAEIFAERWTPLILRELLSGARRFSDIHHGVPRMSRNLLVQRLGALQRSGVVARCPAPNGRGHQYRLTDAGRELGAVIDALGTWGYRWATADLTDEHLDPDFLMWTLRKLVRVDALPDEQVVVSFRFRRHPGRQFWLVLRRPEVDLCVFDPGYDVDVEVDAEVEALARVCLGHCDLARAMKAGQVALLGPSHLRRGLCTWLGATHFAAAS
jgi:DNA-binding HxlR family transcriptional regulator